MKKKRIAAIVASLGLAAMSLAAVPMNAGAQNYKPEDQAQGGTTVIDKYLVLDSLATVPNVNFKFTITPGEALPDGINGIPCYAGKEGAKFVADEEQNVTVSENTATVGFVSTDTTTPEKSVNTKTVVFRTPSNDSDEKFASKSLTVSFEGIKFDEPGIYRYIITEESPTDGGISTPTGHELKYTLFVTVEANEGKLVVANKKYILQEGTDAPEIIEQDVTDDSGNPTGEKVKVNANKRSGLTNWYTTHDLKFNKLVKGNQGSRDKYFKFTVKLKNPEGEDALTMTDLRKNDRFIVKGTFDTSPSANAATNSEYTTIAEGADFTPMKIANSEELKPMSDGAETHSYITYEQLLAGKDFYLHSGHNIEIYGIPEGLGYEVLEYNEDYTPSIEIHSGSGLDSDAEANDDHNTVTDSQLTDTARLTFTNTRGGVIPTGILMTVAGSAGIAAIGIAGVAAGTIYLRKKKSEEE